jgi:hypothetical protein
MCIEMFRRVSPAARSSCAGLKWMAMFPVSKEKLLEENA